MLNKIIIGSAQFGNSYGILNKKKKILIPKIAEEILKYGYKNNIKTVDTALDYGVSEKIIGNSKISKKLKIITKIPKLNNRFSKNNRDKLSTYFYKSIKSLNRKRVYGILLHDGNDLLKKNGNKIYKELLFLKKKKLVSKIGVSLTNMRQINYLVEKFDIDLIQISGNIFDQRFLKNKNFLQMCKKKNIEIHIRSIFLQGLLLTKNIPYKFLKFKKNFLKLNKYLKLKKISQLEACLLFIFNIKFISKVVIGVQNLKQIREIIKILNKIKTYKNINFDNFYCNDEKLINPSKW